MKVLFLTFALSSQLVWAQSYTEKDVVLGEVKGILAMPIPDTDTAVLMIAGSGPTDRDGNSIMGLNNNSLKMLGIDLVNAGYAVLRYDKRGTAASRGAIANQADLRFEDLVADAKGWVKKLYSEGYSKVIIAGHSQGSLVGMMAANGERNVIAFISIAGLAEDAGEAIVRQVGAQSPALGEDARINIDSMKAGHTISRFNPYLISLFGPASQPFLKSYIAYDPITEIQKLSMPVLIVNGTKDLQVGQDQAEKLKEAYPKAEILIIEYMNHVLKTISSDDANANAASYNNPDLPLSEGLSTGIIKFINNLKQ